MFKRNLIISVIYVPNIELW